MINKIKNKKGMLLAGETMKIIIAVICIGFLIYLLTSIYFATSEGKDLREAKGIVEEIRDVAPLLNVTKTVHPMNGLGPGGWVLYGFTSGEEKPNQCEGQSCICICDSPTFYSNEMKTCSEEGECVIIEPLLEGADVEIMKDGSTNIELFKDGDNFGVRKK